jgi:hypothetical protein
LPSAQATVFMSSGPAIACPMSRMRKGPPFR